MLFDLHWDCLLHVTIMELPYKWSLKRGTNIMYILNSIIMIICFSFWTSDVSHADVIHGPCDRDHERLERATFVSRGTKPLKPEMLSQTKETQNVHVQASGYAGR